MSIRVEADALSPRERDVLRELAGHATNAEIAARLFISVRTVESHVAALLRKTGAGDRRELIARASDLLRPAADARTPLGAPPGGASTVTSFVGRVAEREEIAAALREHRLVTALGPGGVGKTRLALAVLADVNDRFPSGGWYVDLVPVLDPGQVAGAIATVLGIHERQGRSLVDAIGDWLADRELLLVLDNCEHLVDGVAWLVEQLLLASPGLTVLATSRTRLAVPFEWVFPVPGLSNADLDEPGDAVLLFEARARAAGAPVAPELRPRIAAVCDALDGMALSIELAAARLPAMGLDGLEAGLADRLPLLSGGRRADDRHRSLRATLDWSYALLPAADRSVLRRVSVFAAPFSAGDAVTVAGDGLAPAAVIAVLAELVDSSLLIAQHRANGTRYRALETIRQYGEERLAEAGETGQARTAHLAWCVARAEALRVPTESAGAGWQEELDCIVDDLRAALAWSRPRYEHRDAAFRLASRLAFALFARGLPAEAQHRFEQAAALAPNDTAAADHLRAAAGAAEARQFGTESLRLRREAADALLRAGDRPGAAIQIARAAELINRGPGIIVPRPRAAGLLHQPLGGRAARSDDQFDELAISTEDVDPMLAEARELAGDDPAAVARVQTAEAFAAPPDAPDRTALAATAIRHAHAEGDVIGESAALDALCAMQLQDGDLEGATDSAVRRVGLVGPLAFAPEVGMELVDALSMSTECALGMGDLRLAGELADRMLAIPYLGGEQHVAASRPLLVTLLAGDLQRCVALADRFLDGWERAGRPQVSNLSPSALSAAAAFALLGDEASAAEWREIAALLLTRRTRPADFEVSGLDALVLLHRGQAADAVRRMEAEPEGIDSWYEAIWRPWYAAWWAEAAVLAGRQDAAARIGRARLVSVPNPVAAAMLDRSQALLDGDLAALPALAERFGRLGCAYQAERTLLLAGPGSAR